MVAHYTTMEKHPDSKIPGKDTIRRFLKASKFKYIKLLKKPLINARNMAKRLEFAKKYSDEDPNFLKNVIWSDETCIRSIPASKEIFMWSNKNIERLEMPHNRQVHSGGFSVMFWGCFSRLGFGPLVAIDGNMDSEKYIKLIEDILIPEINAAKEEFGLEMTFMQDNAPCHKSRRVTQFFDENGLKTLNWPPQSPDMNPIENLWAIIKKRRQKKFGFPATRDALIEQIFKIWDELEFSLCESLSESVPRRLNEVKKRLGKATKY